MQRPPEVSALLAGLFAFLAAGTALLAALAGQYIFDLYPCVLCHYQRWALLGAMIAGLAAALLWNRLTQARLAAGLAALAFAASAAIAFFHVGVEAAWWRGLEGCSAPDFGGGMSREEIKAAILSAPVVACDEVPFRFLGLSMAGWNLVFSAAAAVIVPMILLSRKGATR
ncbi:MAG: disulfide bond formation protein B [Pseudomonadota bacterium]